MDNFLHTYENELREKNITTLNDEEKRVVVSAVVLLLRRHSISNKLCCHNKVNNLEVAGTDHFGFVTKVKCLQCDQMMKTTCHDAKWTYERIYNESQLKPGDHICWHRPYVIWHHAVVVTVRPEINVIHYTSNVTVEQNRISEVHDNKCSCCDALYRINYEDCYDADYTILRAQKLLNESRYNMLDRNCEHFSRWCKTGSTNSVQVGILWASLRKVALMIILRVIALINLGLLELSHETQEENVKDRQFLETLDKWLTGAYIVITTMVFMAYLLITTGSRLHPVRTGSRSITNPCLCSDRYYRYTKNNRCKRWMCCLFFCCLSFICRALCGCILFPIRNIQCCPCTCCQRPWLLSCGLFWRIFWREILAGAATLCVVVFEEEITNWVGITQWPASSRAALLIIFSMMAHFGGYLVGVLVGRMVEACWECRKAIPTSRASRNYIQLA